MVVAEPLGDARRLQDRLGAQKFKTLQTFMIAAVVYWVLTIVFTAIQNRIERRLAAGDRNKEVKG